MYKVLFVFILLLSSCFWISIVSSQMKIPVECETGLKAYHDSCDSLGYAVTCKCILNQWICRFGWKECLDNIADGYACRDLNPFEFNLYCPHKPETETEYSNDQRELRALSLSAPKVGLPFALFWDSEEPEGILDAFGKKTGFTFVLPSEHGGKYISDNIQLNIGEGFLGLKPTPGLLFKGINNLDNGLGAEFFIQSNSIYHINATILLPPFPTSQYELAGIWLGLDEDSYLRLVLTSGFGTSEYIETFYESGGKIESHLFPFNRPDSMTTIRVSIVLNTGTGTAKTFFQIPNVGDDVLVYTFNEIDSSWTSNSLLAGVLSSRVELSFMGDSTDIEYHFGSFSITNPPDNEGPCSQFLTSVEPIISTLPCSAVRMLPPFELDWSKDEGGLVDKNGVGLGLTSYIPASLSVSYIPELLEVDIPNAKLKVTTTSGLFFTNSNTHSNVLGVGLSLPQQALEIRTVLLNPPLGTSNLEQAGLWFGLNEDNYLKLALVSTSSGPQIETSTEILGATGTVTREIYDDKENGIDFMLVIDPRDEIVLAYYRYAGTGASYTKISEFSSLPSSWYSLDSLTNVDPHLHTISFAGLYASHRNGESALVYEFDLFSVSESSLTFKCTPNPSVFIDSPISTLACDAVKLFLPVELLFNNEVPGLFDDEGKEFGFTMFLPSSNGRDFVPENIHLDTSLERLLLLSTEGEFYGSLNSHSNALGVGIPPMTPAVISTTLLDLIHYNDTTGSYEQAGLYFGVNEDNYIKVVFSYTPTGPQIDSLGEFSGNPTPSTFVPQPATPSLGLSIVLDPNSLSATTMFRVGGGVWTEVKQYNNLPIEWFSGGGSILDPQIGTQSFCGVVASHPPGSFPIEFDIGQFSVLAP